MAPRLKTALRKVLDRAVPLGTDTYSGIFGPIKNVVVPGIELGLVFWGRVTQLVRSLNSWGLSVTKVLLIQN